MISNQENLENNFNYNYFLIQTILKMRDSEAQHELAAFWIYFKYAFGLVTSHFDFQLRADIQKDYDIMDVAIKRIEKSGIADSSQKNMINNLRAKFAQAHLFYVMQALNRVGIVKLEEEGTIDFESTDLETFTKIVRSLSSPSVVVENEERKKQEKRDEAKGEVDFIGHDITSSSTPDETKPANPPSPPDSPVQLEWKNKVLKY